jgi:hypothetical protein
MAGSIRRSIGRAILGAAPASARGIAARIASAVWCVRRRLLVIQTASAGRTAASDWNTVWFEQSAGKSAWP